MDRHSTRARRSSDLASRTEPRAAEPVHPIDAPILRADGLVKSFGRRKVVDGVSFEVARGEIVGLLGPNGAGKTTSFRMTCGMIDPDRGSVWLGGIDVTGWPMYRRAKEGGMGYLAQESSIFRKMTVEQNLLAMMELLKMGWRQRRRRAQELLEQFDITKVRRTQAAKLSGGERRRLEIARCLISNPTIILLDEPFAGIDPVTVQSIQGVIGGLKKSGIAVLITDHAAREILQIVDRCYVISDGRVLCDGEPETIKGNDDVRAKYLGNLDAPAPGGPPAPHIAIGRPSSPRDERPATVFPRRRFTSVHESETLDAEDR
ncbi:MAG: LPS export ABC transporter ATP-binding protein [Planctomycetes bacterium]|nr:LPS export ABC transporter ATP-binding protein [Planctomycetota bacterium]